MSWLRLSILSAIICFTCVAYTTHAAPHLRLWKRDFELTNTVTAENGDDQQKDQKTGNIHDSDQVNDSNDITAGDIQGEYKEYENIFPDRYSNEYDSSYNSSSLSSAFWDTSLYRWVKDSLYYYGASSTSDDDNEHEYDDYWDMNPVNGETETTGNEVTEDEWIAKGDHYAADVQAEGHNDDSVKSQDSTDTNRNIDRQFSSSAVSYFDSTHLLFASGLLIGILFTYKVCKNRSKNTIKVHTPDEVDNNRWGDDYKGHIDANAKELEPMLCDNDSDSQSGHLTS